ncbi:MAG TPA: homoserine dehydrogenase [Dermatophilaceae bacterium]|jgi:homoserine dehydrogenase|uniref:Homoserine dehydrogenase n=1 Tax=Candidatus Phosphoribacter hodrii TaxID=2953743 RepID=A0A934X5T8_9MICO|nr:homoserine dehydrogenase [Candidatus Phosphoribacter hodrii]MBP8837450.1 homoserine dehydrogenase [Dermatophilaceae bacterium]MBL0005251.1 homoserine dehydrogenase [Candidatus Phosphoribacter hodrii]HOA01438.1 homoserine dehydrogenase [Dermatophilaceae bacterium]HOA58716.1 homoserine dehydrogenase [Dermatophilaceae bacterium]
MVSEREDVQGAPVRVALIGCGVVGSAVARLLIEHADDLAARVGRPLELVGIGVRRPGRNRGDGLDPALFTTDSADLVTRADVVIEVVGGIEPARTLILRAMAHGASVVTANKALLAEDGPTLYAAAAEHGVDLYFEAAVAGGIPLLRPLRESLAGDSVRKVMGIVNGTTNYVLDKMDTTGQGFADAVSQAQALGYAEADPTADVEGFDAAAKAAILASLAFHTRVAGKDVHREGITEVTAADIQAAKDMDCVVKLLAICERTDGEDGSPAGVSVRVHPAMIPRRHPLAGVREAFNAVFVEAEAAGQLMFYGRGAGGEPTASAVLGDVVAVARHRVLGGRGPGESAYADLPLLDMGQALTRYHISLDVADRPGVLAQVASAFADHEVSIETVRQQQVVGGAAADAASGSGGSTARASLVVVTHVAPEAALSATVDALAALPVVRGVNSVMRVEGV